MREHSKVKDQSSNIHARTDSKVKKKKTNSETDRRTYFKLEEDIKEPSHSIDVKKDTMKVPGMSKSFKSACDNIGPSKQLSGRNYTVNFVTDPKHKVMFCEIFKCASTFWKGILNDKVRKAAPTDRGCHEPLVQVHVRARAL
ncbi:hypothetical protein FSP39_016139 [Pinctada imbricata]|uniref:Uncharacterized protein n=1 Tax=Pinctada imbricata TaxID=66713 RepID=A0AA88XJB2_PINIB|nr:hypothetical protein FSP39_016139 [Pinctada imbricata]